jgi:hypothetical protein
VSQAMRFLLVTTRDQYHRAEARAGLRLQRRTRVGRDERGLDATNAGWTRRTRVGRDERKRLAKTVLTQQFEDAGTCSVRKRELRTLRISPRQWGWLREHRSSRARVLRCD